MSESATGMNLLLHLERRRSALKRRKNAELKVKSSGNGQCFMHVLLGLIELNNNDQTD